MNPELLCMRCMGRLNKPDESCPHCGASPLEYVNAANQLECGSILAGTYLVGCVLGQGGFGITYIGLDLNLNLKVAIKEYYPEGYVTREGQTHSTVLPLPGERRTLFERGKEKFVSEAQVLAKFNEDASIVGVRGFFQENGTVYIVMNFVEGETLKEFATKRGGKIPAMEVLAMMEPLLESLSKVHAAGLLHRDISPDNIMRRKNGSIVLLDFGAARQMSIDGEHSNTINVKHGFAPEEQYRTHGEQGPWTDVYALCATIYRLTTGVTPQQALDRAMSNTTLLSPNKLGADFSIPEEQAILHGLAVRADQRIQDIKQLHKELKGDNPREHRWSLDACVGYARLHGLFEADEMVCTKTLYNAMRAGQMPLTPFELPEMLKRKRRESRKRAHKRLKGQSIEERPSVVHERSEIGHWEADTVVGRRAGKESVVLTLLEKCTDHFIVLRIPSRTSEAVMEAMSSIRSDYGDKFSQIFKTITTDNGSEFEDLSEIEQWGTNVYFAHPYSSWERPQNERHNGLLRRYIPKGVSIDRYHAEEILAFSDEINGLPRRLLGYRTPEELFDTFLDKVFAA